jgi:hypothetical protein
VKFPTTTILQLARDGLEHVANGVGRVLRNSLDRPTSHLPADDTRAASGFRTEAEMLPTLREAATALWIRRDPSRTWVMLEEQLMHSRIADLVLVRLDIEVVRARLDGGWQRPLGLAELRVLAALRSDRYTSAMTVAQAVKMEPTNVTRILRTLSGDGEQVTSGPGRLSTKLLGRHVPCRADHLSDHRVR